MALGKRCLCRVPGIRHSAKRVLNFFKKISSLPSASTGALGKEIIKKIKSLPSTVLRALGKVFFFKKNSLPSARSETLGNEFFFKKIKSLPSDRSGALGKEFFFKKESNLCRVPNSRHSAKKAVTEHRFAGSLCRV